jgi:hypothetical protein
MSGDESVLEALTTELERLENNATFKVVEFGASGTVVWTIRRDTWGTPVSRWVVVDSVPAADPTAFYYEQLEPSLEGRLLLVALTTLSYPRDVVRLLREEQNVPVYNCLAPLEEHIKAVIKVSPLRTYYELLVLRQVAGEQLTLATYPLFPPDAKRGYTTEFEVTCAPTDENGTVFAVVTYHPGNGGPGAPPRMHPIEIQSAVIAPKTYDVRAVLARPGHVDFRGLPVKLEPDPRKLEDIRRTVPPELRAAAGAHLVCMLEVSGGPESLEQRIERLESLIDTAESGGRPLKVSLVTYGPHAVERNGAEDPAMTLTWATTSHLAKLKLREVQEGKVRQALERESRQAGDSEPEREYGRAAQLECALREVNGRLTMHDGYPVLVTTGARPPHPAKVDLATEIIPCRHKVRWQDELSRLKDKLPRLRFGALFGPSPLGDIWRDLGHDAHGDLEVVDMPMFAAQLGLRDPVQAVPFPIVGQRGT